VGAEFKRPTVQPDALDHVLRARALYLGRVPTRQNYAAQIALYEHALGLHPGSEKVQSFLAWQLAARVLDQMTDSAATALAHYAKAQVLRAQQRFEGAISEYEKVLELNRNWVHAIAALGHGRFVTGSIEAVIPARERAIRLSPRDPKIWLFYYWIGQAHLLQQHVGEAVLWFDKASSANLEHPLPHAYLASTYALKGEMGRAAAELGLARSLSGDDRYRSLARLRGTFRSAEYPNPVRNKLFIGPS